MNEPTAPDLDLRAFLHVLRRRMWVVFLVPVLTVAAAVGAAMAKTPQYRSSAEILLVRTQAETIFNPLQSSADPNRLLANQIRVIQSEDVSGLATKRLGFDAEVKATASQTEDVITLRAVDVDPKRAAAIVNAYARAYLEYRRSSGASENATAQAELRRQIGAAQGRLDALDAEVNARPLTQRELARAGQAEERQAVAGQLSESRSQLSRLEAAANVERGGAQLLAPASVPRHPFEPNPRRSGALGLAVGLMLGVGMALLFDYLDNRIRTTDDLQGVAGGLPVVGIIPNLSGWRNRKAAHVVSLEEPSSALSEAYRSLRTSIQFLGLDRSLRTLQVTSAASAEGKTTTLVNLAVALARAGQRVVVADCDLRRPRVHEFFDLEPSAGFTSVLVGDVALSKALQRVPAVDGLRVLPAGPVPPNPSELLSGPRTTEVLAILQADADVVLIDSPPVLPVSDAAALSRQVDGTLFVATANATRKKQLARALEQLRQVEAVVIGVVLNRTSGKWSGYEDYGYGYRPYVPDTPKHKRKPTRSEVNKAEPKETAKPVG